MSQSENAAQAVQPQQAPDAPDARSGTPGVFVVVFYIILALAIALFNATSRPIVITFVVTYHWYGFAAAVIVAGLLLPRTRQRAQVIANLL